MDYLKLNEEKLRKLCEDGLRGKYSIALNSVTLPLTNKCNNYCIMCPHINRKYENHTFYGEPPYDTTLKDCKKMIKMRRYHRNSNIIFELVGAEPLLNPDVYEIVKYIRKTYPNSFIKFISNGTIPPKQADMVKYIDQIGFSVDGCTNETFHYLRPPANLDHVLKVITKWDEAASLYNDNMQIVLTVVASSKNIHEIAGIVRMASQFKHIEAVYLQPMTLNDTQQHLRHLLLDNVSDNVLKEEINNVEQTSKETGVRVDNLTSLERQKEHNDDEEGGLNCSIYCRYFWNGIIPIKANNQIDGICCYMENRGKPLISKYNVPSKGKIDKIYNSKGYWQMRKDMLDGKLEDYCKNCSMRNAGYKLFSEKEINLDEYFYV